MVTQPRDPNNKNKHAYKKIVLIVIEHITPSLLVSKNQRDDENKRDAYARSKSPQKSFVQYFRSPSNDRTERFDTNYRSRRTSRTEFYNKRQTHKTDIALQPETDSVMTKILLPHNTLDHDLTIINKIHDPIALVSDLLTDLLIDMTPVIDKDHVHIQEIITILQATHLLTDHLQDQEILDTLHHVHIQTQEINLIQYNHNTKRTQVTLKYTCIIQLKWLIL